MPPPGGLPGLRTAPMVHGAKADAQGSINRLCGRMHLLDPVRIQTKRVSIISPKRWKPSLVLVLCIVCDEVITSRIRERTQQGYELRMPRSAVSPQPNPHTCFCVRHSSTCHHFPTSASSWYPPPSSLAPCPLRCRTPSGRCTTSASMAPRSSPRSTPQPAPRGGRIVRCRGGGLVDRWSEVLRCLHLTIHAVVSVHPQMCQANLLAAFFLVRFFLWAGGGKGNVTLLKELRPQGQPLEVRKGAPAAKDVRGC